MYDFFKKMVIVIFIKLNIFCIYFVTNDIRIVIVAKADGVGM